MYMHICAPFSSLRFRGLGSVVGPARQVFLHSDPFVSHRDNDDSRDMVRPLVAVVLVAPVSFTCLPTNPNVAARRDCQLLALSQAGHGEEVSQELGQGYRPIRAVRGMGRFGSV